MSEVNPIRWMLNATKKDSSPIVIDLIVLGGKDKYAVRRDGEVLSCDGHWEYEPMPSQRNEDFYERFRFETLNQAVEVATEFQSR